MLLTKHMKAFPPMKYRITKIILCVLSDQYVMKLKFNSKQNSSKYIIYKLMKIKQPIT